MNGLCRSHETWLRAETTPDPFYEQKIVLGLTQPTWEYLSEAECQAVVNGRYRGDGRRIDIYVTDLPLLIDLEEQ